MFEWRLREVMAQKRIGVNQLAEALGKHRNTILQWRKLDKMPKINGEELELLIRKLDCTPDQLIGFPQELKAS